MANSSFGSAWPGVTATFGVLLIIAGLLMPAMSDPAQAITQEQADEFYESATAIEHATANRAKQIREKKAPDNAEQARELQAARERFTAAKEEVESAKDERKSLAFWLKMGGVVFVVIGAGGLFAQKSGG
ncbi:hypothetical protein [Bythopirellula polymerisocia]|uniref:Uncharacterized protein n=1 Tax=Bythopirellula polymerisocia TaxID=2528003 RepID=A0A5C6CIM6_9BACT|nr:hypothetical protein [Bythopirellula polymerisocia]TWU23517.1 hypothetical protein Pla144_36920 [Bythopirellula polymerisocia]